MGFMDSYKRLEKLCGDILGDERKVSAYIDEMTAATDGECLVPGWSSDLRQLKHFRWVRNRIAHDPGCTEENMCEPGDSLWINEFYSRIMNQTDPLALRRRERRRMAEYARQRTAPSAPPGTYRPYTYAQNTRKTNEAEKQRGKAARWLAAGLLVCLIVILYIIIYIVPGCAWRS